MREDCKVNDKIHFVRYSRDYSEERKQLFISQADAKWARLEASEAMINFQPCRNESVYDLVDKILKQSDHGNAGLSQKNFVDDQNLRNDNLSMVQSTTEKRSSVSRRKKLSESSSSKLDSISHPSVLNGRKSNILILRFEFK